MSLESGNVKEKLNSAIEKLFTLKPLINKSLKTSRHDFGIEEEEKDTIIYDRCTFEIEIKRNTFITCNSTQAFKFKCRLLNIVLL